MAALDGRLARKESHPVGLVAKKVRKIGSPSQSLPPANAPSWAVNPEYNKGKTYYTSQRENGEIFHCHSNPERDSVHQTFQLGKMH